MHLSPNHLAQLFTDEVGVSPRQFLLRERVRRAKELLQGSDAAITSIALDLGFSSSQHFAKMFKRSRGAPRTRFVTSLLLCPVREHAAPVSDRCDPGHATEHAAKVLRRCIPR